MSSDRTAPPAVVVVGDIMADVAVHRAGPVALESDTDCEIALAGGGSAANLAAHLAGLGIATTLVGTVGDDQLGSIQLADLTTRGVQIRVRILNGVTTGMVVALVGQDGRRSMLTSRGAGSLLSPDHLGSDLFRPGRHLHLSGYVLLDERSRAAGLAALERARRASMTVSVDASSLAPLARLGGGGFRSLTAGASVLFTNEAEAGILTGARSWEEALDALLLDYQQVVLKRGESGAVWASGQERISLPATSAVARDTTGAGDALAAGWLAGWLRGQDPAVILGEALGLAATVLSWPGGRPLLRAVPGVA
ncbi:MAG: sugar kinase [Candidatus Dormibacteria bacterium]